MVLPNDQRSTGSRSTIGNRNVPRCRGDECGNIQPVESPLLETWEEVGRVAGLVPILPLEQFGFIGAQLGDEVELLASVGQIEQGIEDELLTRMTRPHHRSTVEDRGAFGKSAPQQRPVPFGHPFVGVEVAAYDRVDPVAGDQHRTLRRATDRAGATIDERRLDTVGRFDESVEMAAGVNALSTDVELRCGVQDGVQHPTMNGDLWPSVPGRQTPRLIPDEFAAFGEVGQRRRSQAFREQVVTEPEGVELADRVRKEVDAHTERLDPIDALEDPHREPGAVQAQRHRQTTDSTPGDDDVVHPSGHHTQPR